MKKKFPLLLSVLMLLSLATVAGYKIYQRSAASPGLPSIHFASGVPNVPTNASDAELLNGVTATDPEDGDVTASVMVEGMSGINENNDVKVSYVAFDLKNHMTRAVRTVHLTDYEDTRFELSSALNFKQSDKIDVLERVKATDMLDGDLSDKVKYSLEGDTVNINNIGKHEIVLRVTNSLGRTVHLPLIVEVTSNEPNSANIKLDSYVIYLSRGESFDAKSHVVGYTANGESRTGADGISVSGRVNTDEAGVYTVEYTYWGSSGRSHTSLVVVVE